MPNSCQETATNRLSQFLDFEYLVINYKRREGKLEKYIHWLQQQGKSEHTIRRYKTVLKEFQQWYEGMTGGVPFDPKNVSAIDLQDWKNYLINIARIENPKTGERKKLTISTVNNKIESLKAYFRYLYDTGIIKDNPASSLSVQKQQTPLSPRWLERVEKNKLLHYIDDKEKQKKNPWRYARNRAIIYCMLHAGMRVSEVVELELEDIDFANGYINIRDGKGGKARRIPMNSDLKHALSLWISERKTKETNTNKVFVSQKGGNLTISGVNNLFNKIRHDLKIEELTPHVLRHTFCHDLIEKGFPITYVADLAGHSDLDTTRRYVATSDKEMKIAVESLSSGRYRQTENKKHKGEDER